MLQERFVVLPRLNLELVSQQHLSFSRADSHLVTSLSSALLLQFNSTTIVKD